MATDKFVEAPAQILAVPESTEAVGGGTIVVTVIEFETGETAAPAVAATS